MTSELFGPTVTTGPLIEATGDRAWLRGMLDAEAALAAAEADTGLIPAGAAAVIGHVCRTGEFDIGAIGREARAGGNPVIPLVAALTEAAGPDAGAWVHWGATSQDILDTAASLVATRSASLIAGHLADLGDGCAALARGHRATITVGRTLLQPALPTTFGAKAAAWLAGVDDAAAELDRSRGRLAAQLGGAAGTLASLGSDGPAVVDRFAAHLGLAAPALPWHTARQRTAALAGALGIVAGTAAKISGDIGLLAQAEVGEAAEPAAPGRGGSSTLPHKRNPVGAAAVNAAARRALALVPVLQGGLLAEHERALGAWQAEWEPLGELLALAGGAAARTAETVAGLEVDTDAMATNVAAAGEALVAERISLTLARRLGRAEARRQVAEATRTGRSLASLLEPGEADRLLDPRAYLGSVDLWMDRALASRPRSEETP